MLGLYNSHPVVTYLAPVTLAACGGRLEEKVPGYGEFTYGDAVRIYLWNKHGYDIPGLSKTDQANLSELVMSDPQLQTYAETLNVISKQDTYVEPGKGWDGGNIKTDTISVLEKFDFLICVFVDISPPSIASYPYVN